MKVKAIYRSNWNEGTVETECMLDVETGVVSDIQTANYGADYEHLITEEVVVFAGSEMAFEVEQHDGDEYIIGDENEIAKLQELIKFQIMTVMAGGNENTQATDGVPMYFKTSEEAQADIDELIRESQASFKAGNIDAPYASGDYAIQNIETGKYLQKSADSGSRESISKNTGDDVKEAVKRFKHRAKQLGVDVSGIKHTHLLELISTVFGVRNRHVVLAEKSASPDLSEKDRLLNDVADVMEAFTVHGDVSDEIFMHWVLQCRKSTGNLPDGMII